MPNKIFTTSCVSAAALGLMLAAVPAYAGFEWVPPSAPSVYVPPASPAPSRAQMPEIISPVIISGDQKSAAQMVAPPSSAPTPLMPSEPTPSSYAAFNATPVAPPSAPTRIDLSTATIAVPAPAGGDVVRGFASQVPLTLALRQVLPSAYSFTLDQDVDMDTLVSYQGGKTWRDTLADIVASVGLAAHEQGSVVTVSRASAAGVVMPPQVTKSTVDLPALMPVSAPSSALPQAPVLDAAMSAPAGSWTAARGDTLHKVLTDWCQRAGVELQWLAEYDYPVEASAHFNGSFEDALRGLLAGFEGAHPQPTGELHANATAGQGVLVVQTRGNSAN